MFYDIDCKWILLIIGTLSNPYISGIIYTLGLIFIVFYFQVEISKKRIKKDFRCNEILSDIYYNIRIFEKENLYFKYPKRKNEELLEYLGYDDEYNIRLTEKYFNTHPNRQYDSLEIRQEHFKQIIATYGKKIKKQATKLAS